MATGMIQGEHFNITDIYKQLCPAGSSIAYEGPIAAQGSTYILTISLPIPASAVTISCSEFRPSGQTAVKDTSPTVTKVRNLVYVKTTNSSFSSYVGKLGLASLTISYPS